MGRTKTYTSSTVVSLVTDFPNLVQQSVLNSIVRGGDITTDLITNLTNSSASKMGSYYHSARRAKKVVNTFPSTSGSLHTNHVIDVKYVLSGKHDNKPIKMVRCVVEALDTNFLAYEYMYKKYGYDYMTDTFKSLPNGLPLASTKFYDSTIDEGELLIEYTNGKTIPPPEDTPEDDEHSEDAEYLEVVYTERTGLKNLSTYKTYYHCIYKVGSATELHYWNYDTSTGVYPYLNQSVHSFVDSYMPVIPVIRYGTNLVDSLNKKGDEYKLYARLLKGLGLKYENLSDSLKENGKGYKYITQAHFVPAVRLKDTSQDAYKYIFHYFIQLGSKQKYTMKHMTEWTGMNGRNQPPANILKHRSNGFMYDMKWFSIDHKIVKKNWTHGKNEYARFYRINDKLPIGSALGTDTWYYDTSTITYLRKISDTEQEQVTMYGMVVTNFVDNKYSHSWDTKKAFKDGEDSSDAVLFLVDNTLVHKVFPKLLDRNDFYYKTYSLIACTKQRVRKKWYQTGIFKFVITVIGIVVMIYTGYDFVGMLYQAALLGAAQVAIVSLTYAFYAAVASVVMEWAVEEFGVFGAIVATAVMAYLGTQYGGDFLSGMGSFSEALMTHIDLAMASITDYYAEATEDLYKDMAEMEKNYDAWKTEYDTMMDEMFGLGDSFAEIYKKYTQDKAIYYRMYPDSYMFNTIDMITMLPEMVLQQVSMWTDNALAVTSEDALI